MIRDSCPLCTLLDCCTLLSMKTSDLANGEHINKYINSVYNLYPNGSQQISLMNSFEGGENYIYHLRHMKSFGKHDWPGEQGDSGSTERCETEGIHMADQKL